MATDASNLRGPGGDAALQALRQALWRAHLHNGEPSTRVIAARTGRAISHTTVAAVLRCERLPRWGQIELVAEALAADVNEFHRLWIAARKAQSGQQCGQESVRLSDTAPPGSAGVQLRVRFVKYQTLALQGCHTHVGLVDCGQLVEWYGAYERQLFSRTIRSFWHRPEASDVTAHLQRDSPELLWTCLNGVTILAKSVHIAEGHAATGYLDAIATYAQIVNGVQTIMVMSHASRDAQTDLRRAHVAVRIVIDNSR